tara:strand:+ start:161 stop:523 length:363 start_codon:yes stop_codon:yes gene_type:complete
MTTVGILVVIVARIVGKHAVAPQADVAKMESNVVKMCRKTIALWQIIIVVQMIKTVAVGYVAAVLMKIAVMMEVATIVQYVLVVQNLNVLTAMVTYCVATIVRKRVVTENVKILLTAMVT